MERGKENRKVYWDRKWYRENGEGADKDKNIRKGKHRGREDRYLK